MTEPSLIEWLDMPVRITRDAVYFGDTKVPGVIAQGGVTVKPGGATDINQVTITFLVGAIEAVDPTRTEGKSCSYGGLKVADGVSEDPQ